MIKRNKGITLTSLIITIIVMVILAGVALSMTIGEDGIIKKAESVGNIYAEAKIDEELSLYSLEYYLDTGKELKNETKDEIKEIYKVTNVSTDKLVIYYDLYNINKNKENGNKDLKEEIVLYRIDKTTKEERQRLKEAGIYPLKGDVDLDGKLTMNDYKLIEEINMYASINGKDIFDVNGVEYKGDYYAKDLVTLIEIADFDGDGYPDGGDMGIVEWLALGLCPLEDYNWCFEEF